MSNPASGSGPAAPVLVDRSGAVATVRLARPEAMNGLDTATKVALLDALREVAADEAVRCVVLAGSGRAFCVGQDLKEHAALLDGDDAGAPAGTVREHYNPIVLTLATMPKPVVAAVNGVAAGAGAAFAFACDLRVLADTAGFNLAFTGIGLSCDSGTSWTLPRLVGHAKAVELLYLPRTLSAAESAELGLATEVVPAADLEARVAELAGRLADGPTHAYAAVRRSLVHAAGHDLVSALEVEAELMTLTGSTSDHREGVRAFLAKESPRFRGR